MNKPSRLGQRMRITAAHDGAPSATRILCACAGVLAALVVLTIGLSANLHFLPAIVAIGGLSGAFLMLSGEGEPGWQMLPGRQRGVPETPALLSTIHDALGDIAIVRDMDGRIVQSNGVFHQVLGRVNVMGLTCASLGLSFEPKPDPDHFLVRVATAGGERLFDWHDVIVREPGRGRLVRHSIGRDVTEEARAAREREAARHRAEEASQAKSRLLATVTHEIRTPLSGILGMSHLLGQTELSAEQRNYLADMQQSGHALVQLVEDLIDFSSLSAGRFQLHPSRQDLRLVVENVVEMLSHRAHEKGIEIGATIAADVPTSMIFDAARLRQVLFNVVGNAVKFTETGGVLVSVARIEGALRIRIDDSGPGMSEVEVARVFEEFEQAGDDAQRAKGTGLGLAISRRIMEAFRGSLTASSVAGKGSRFEICFAMEGAEPSLPSRNGVLAGAHVLVMAPEGPASAALAATIETLGGSCHRAPTLDAARSLVKDVLQDRLRLTDIIVDHRRADDFQQLLLLHPALDRLGLRRTYLINPEERSSHPVHRLGGYAAWLIRPLREKSLVEVLLGRLKGIESRDAIADNRPVLRDAPATAGAGKAVHRVVLAEDDPVNALMLRTMLERNGHAVQHVADFSALETLLHEPGANWPAIVVTDLNMPGGDLPAMLRRLRREGASHDRRRLPVLVLTSDGRSDLHQSLTIAGADAVLTKPAQPAQLLAEVARLIETGKA
ncbi:hybrid sensor histidine kinase/response regulator [Sinorhizobium alkalisoli]|uniref:hybrid sensor histidine kinase/response regulator n=1 Tax=Sinorhizobium alkalisoli TaxID=1752398 RepID=UPI00124E0E4E|nr:ATP-binding protein [Sinorhizobium alkalisoli]